MHDKKSTGATAGVRHFFSDVPQFHGSFLRPLLKPGLVKKRYCHRVDETPYGLDPHTEYHAKTKTPVFRFLAILGQLKQMSIIQKHVFSP